MDKTYTFSDLVREFNFDSASTRKLFTAKGIKPSKVLMVGKRKIELYGQTAHAVAKAERDRRNAERAAKGRKSPAVNLKKEAPKDLVVLEKAYWRLGDQLDSMDDRLEQMDNQLARIESAMMALQSLPTLLAGMESRLGARYTGFPDFGKAPLPDLKVTCGPTTGDPNKHVYETLAAAAEMALTDD